MPADADLPPGLLRLAPGVTVPEAACTFSQSRSGGPGGQHVNTTASKVELRLPVRAITGLSLRQEDRFIVLAGDRLTADGELILTCDETRSAGRNRGLVVERLCALVRDAQAVPKPRRATKPSRGAIQRRLESKAHRSAQKRERRGDEAG